MPDERVLEQLCALSGDDLAVMAAQIQSERARTQEGKNMWSMIAKRLAGGANPAILSLAFAIFIVAGYAQPASADDLPTLGIQEAGSLYIVLSTYFVCALLSWSLYQRFKSGSVR